MDARVRDRTGRFGCRDHDIIPVLPEVCCDSAGRCGPDVRWRGRRRNAPRFRIMRSARTVRPSRGRGRETAPMTRRCRQLWSLSDRKSVVWGKSVSVRVDLGGRRIVKKKKKQKTKEETHNQNI